MSEFVTELFKNAKECGMTIFLFVLIFLVFQVVFIKMNKESLKRTLVGVFLSYLGLVLLLTGLKLCYVPIARAIGIELSTLSYKWVIVPLGFLLGFVMTRVEPSVKVLIADIERETGGALNDKVLSNTMAIGVGISLAIAMLKLLLDFSLWYILVIGYAVIIILAFFVEEKFTAIALDAGGVTTGVMTTTFLSPLALGIAEGLPWTDTVTDGFGIIAIVAMTPIIMVMLLGMIYTKKEAKKDGGN